MSLLEIRKSITRNFFIIFTCSIFVLMILYLMAGMVMIHMRDVIAALVISILTDLCFLVFYSQKEPSKKEQLVRNIIHAVLVIGIALGVAVYMGWVYIGLPFSFLPFLIASILVYIIVAVSEYAHDKKIAKKLNQKLGEKYGVAS